MWIVDLTIGDERRISEAAQLLMNGFAGTGSTSWSTPDEARLEVHASLQEGRVSRVALDNKDAVVGWIGGISSYGGLAWELHPLVVRRDSRRRGVGRALVADLEEQVRRRGAVTLYLGTDDENGRTSLGGRDLYPRPLDALAGIRNLDDHPYEFYLKAGFVLTGVIPDANGFGKPDILMAKRVGDTPPHTRRAEGGA
jgi:aminoglycoside 6'-N-acetyltransferase I